MRGGRARHQSGASRAPTAACCRSGSSACCCASAHHRPGAAAAARHRSARSQPRPLSAAARRVAPQCPGPRIPRADSRGCSRTTATSTSRPALAGRRALQDVSHLRESLCDPTGGRDRRIRFHWPARHRLSRGRGAGDGRVRPAASRLRLWPTRCAVRSTRRATWPSSSAARSREREYTAANVGGTRAVAVAARTAGAPLIHISSLAAAARRPPAPHGPNPTRLRR